MTKNTKIPLLGLGLWQVRNDETCVSAVKWAIEAGYPHVDTAQAYGNEEAVGEGLRQSGVAREDIFVTTKFYPGDHGDPAEQLEASLERLGLDFVDLYIIHWPQAGPTWAWPGMERALERGHAREIGVSNFNVQELEALLEVASARPVVNQVQFSPFEHRAALLEACERHGVVLEAYSPLGTGRHLGNKTIAGIAERLERTSAQVLLRWCVQRGIPVIPKSTHRERIAENGQIFDFELSDDDLAQLDALDTTGGTGNAVEKKWWS